MQKKLSCAQGDIQKLHITYVIVYVITYVTNHVTPHAIISLITNSIACTLTHAIVYVMHSRQLRYHLRDPVNYHIYH